MCLVQQFVHTANRNSKDSLPTLACSVTRTTYNTKRCALSNPIPAGRECVRGKILFDLQHADTMRRCAVKQPSGMSRQRCPDKCDNCSFGSACKFAELPR